VTRVGRMAPGPGCKCGNVTPTAQQTEAVLGRDVAGAWSMAASGGG